MNYKNILKDFVLLSIPILMISIGQTIVKYGAIRLNNSEGTFIYVILLIGYSFLILRGIIWIFILRKIDLIIAYPFLSITYIIILLISYFIFKEQISTFQIIGSMVIISGIIFISFGNLKK